MARKRSGKLKLYRRHLSACKHKGKGRTFDRCGCPIWIQGTWAGKSMRESLGVDTWEKAEELKRNIEDGIKPKQEGVTLREALTKFLADRKHLNSSTLRKYGGLERRLNAFGQNRGLHRCEDFTTDSLRDFRSTWNLAPRTAGKELERLRAFFNFCVENDWITKSPAKAIKTAKVKDNPTLPLSDVEIAKIMSHADFRTQVFFRVLLHSGVRIIDAAQLRPEKITDGKLFLYTQKTGVPVMCPLPPDLLADLLKLPLVGGFYFAVQSVAPVSIAERYRQKLNQAAIKAGLGKKKVKGTPRGKNIIHPHRFRDTFAVRLLEKGVSLETVSILLGHTDLKTTQRSYAPWVQSLQRNLELAVQKTWASTKLVRVK